MPYSYLPDLAITECDGEPPKVPVDDLDGVVGGAGDVEGGGAARYHLLHLPVTPGVVNHHVWSNCVGRTIRQNGSKCNLTIMTIDVEKIDDEQPEGNIEIQSPNHISHSVYVHRSVPKIVSHVTKYLWWE